ncbi:hypothetical protein E4U50_001117 [Claviceps purpurea]|nr:hypothetical protein E4U50_001117 [Claviceps purpurea]
MASFNQYQVYDDFIRPDATFKCWTALVAQEYYVYPPGTYHDRMISALPSRRPRYNLLAHGVGELLAVAKDALAHHMSFQDQETGLAYQDPDQPRGWWARSAYEIRDTRGACETSP